MTNATATAIYLFWGPQGTDAIERFARSWRLHPPGAGHRLVVLRKALSTEQAACCSQIAAELGADELDAAGGLDLASYRVAAEALSERLVCFLNTSSEILVDGWLDLMVDALTAPGVGVVGATGSHETLLQWTPAALRPLNARRLPAFPNPHVRTTAFVIERERLLSLRWGRPRSKRSAWALENGRASLTRQIEALGLGARVVGRDGTSYPPSRWRTSHTFRSGEQENLLVADNRTREYAAADPDTRARLTAASWGT